MKFKKWYSSFNSKTFEMFEMLRRMPDTCHNDKIQMFQSQASRFTGTITCQTDVPAITATFTVRKPNVHVYWYDTSKVPDVPALTAKFNSSNTKRAVLLAR